MGLPRFWIDWLIANYGDLFIVEPVEGISALAIDGNAILYGVHDQTYNLGEFSEPSRQVEIDALLATEQGHFVLKERFFTNLFQLIRNINDRFAPADCFVMVFDGPCPIPKMYHQRQRRFRSYRSGPPQINPVLDTLQFSPGTDLMLEINQRTRKWLDEIWSKGWELVPRGSTSRVPNPHSSGGVQGARSRSKTPETPLPKRIIYSGPDIPGEGEHKIMAYFRQGMITGTGAKIIYGQDADLAVLTLGLRVGGIYLARTHDVTDRRAPLMPIDTLRERILEKIGATEIDDFICLVNMIGNDFLPPLPGLGLIPANMNLLTDCYRRMQYRLVVNGEVQLAGFRELLALLYERRERLYESFADYHQYPYFAQTAISVTEEAEPELERASRHGPAPVRRRVVSVDYVKFRQLWYRQWGIGDIGQIGVTTIGGTSTQTVAGSGQTSLGAFGALQTGVQAQLGALSTELLSELTSAENWATDIAADFIRMLRWIVSYYLIGQDAVNWNVVYPHFRGPLVEDMLQYANSLPSWPDQIHRDADTQRLSVFHQMIAILPKRSLLPDFLRAASSYFPDMYPVEFPVSSEGAPDRGKWGKEAVLASTVRLPDQTISYIPMIDPTRIFNNLLNMKVSKQDQDRYTPGTTMIRDLEDPEYQRASQEQFYMNVSSDPKLLRSLVVGGPSRGPVQTRDPRIKPSEGKPPEGKPSEGKPSEGKPSGGKPPATTDPRQFRIPGIDNAIDGILLQEYALWSHFHAFEDSLLRQIPKEAKSERHDLKEILSRYMVRRYNQVSNAEEQARVELGQKNLRINFNVPANLDQFTDLPDSLDIQIASTPSEIEITVRPKTGPYFRSWIPFEMYRLMLSKIGVTPHGSDFPVEPPQLARLIRVLMRYDRLLTHTTLHWSLPPALWSVVLGYYPKAEGFGWPGNVTLQRFYSLFPDVDQPFGSLGNFLMAVPITAEPESPVGSILPGFYICHPPSIPEIVQATLVKITDLISRSEPYIFLLFLTNPIEIPSAKARVDFQPGGYALIDGAGRAVNPTVPSAMYILTNTGIVWIQEMMTQRRQPSGEHLHNQYRSEVPE